MGTIIKAGSLMGCRKDMATMYGRMDQTIKVILRKDLEMDLESGGDPRPASKTTRDNIKWIKKMASEYISGTATMSIEETLKTIKNRDKESFTMKVDSCIKAGGIMEIKSKKKN